MKGTRLSRSTTPPTAEDEFRMEDFNRWLSIPQAEQKKKGPKARGKGSKGSKLSQLLAGSEQTDNQ